MSGEDPNPEAFLQQEYNKQKMKFTNYLIFSQTVSSYLKAQTCRDGRGPFKNPIVNLKAIDDNNPALPANGMY